MRIKLLLIITAFLFVCNANGQDLHDDANAASTTNEANATTGWTGAATITSDATDTQSGNFSIRAVSTSNNGRTLDYLFNATIGQAYTIRIWAKAGPQVSNPASPAFAAWNGLSGFSVTPITTTQWTEYVFNVTATIATPRIRVYTSNYPTRFTAGNTIFIDNVSILPAGGDTQAPTAPTNLTSSNTTTTTTDLSWTASTDNVGVTDYEVFQDGNSIGFSGGSTTFNVTGLTASTSYAFTIFARDAANNISPVSNTENVTTNAGGDTQAPTAPTNLTSSNTTTTTTDLSWTASTDNVGVTDYQVFQDGNSIGFTGGATTFNVTGLTASTSYAFTVFARDAANNISPVSNTENVTTNAGGGGTTDYTSANSNLPTVDWQARDLFADRNVGIGTTNTQGYRLAVAGNVVAEEISVKLQANWPDYVFEESYRLPTLAEVERHIAEKGYLINMPSAKEVEEGGIELGIMNAKLLEKIEELTLYTLEQEKTIKELRAKNAETDLLLKRLLERLNSLEQKNK